MMVGSVMGNFTHSVAEGSHASLDREQEERHRLFARARRIVTLRQRPAERRRKYAF
ncbi:hypothetical protein AB4Z48_20295 [Cupriavidus sp. 2TAF22]|uniref:hypothetical protein n=1 Tax=unclassified Cupriavidus TaxID=2640874 RepID=UPI003F929978